MSRDGIIVGFYRGILLLLAPTAARLLTPYFAGGAASVIYKICLILVLLLVITHVVVRVVLPPTKLEEPSYRYDLGPTICLIAFCFCLEDIFNLLMHLKMFAEWFPKLLVNWCLVSGGIFITISAVAAVWYRFVVIYDSRLYNRGYNKVEQVKYG